MLSPRGRPAGPGRSPPRTCVRTCQTSASYPGSSPGRPSWPPQRACAGETRGPRAFNATNLRPYLPVQRYLRRIGAGPAILAAAVWRGGRDVLRRVIGAPAKKASSKDELADAFFFQAEDGIRDAGS